MVVYRPRLRPSDIFYSQQSRPPDFDPPNANTPRHVDCGANSTRDVDDVFYADNGEPSRHFLQSLSPQPQPTRSPDQNNQHGDRLTQLMANTSVCSVGKFGTVTESEKIGHSSPACDRSGSKIEWALRERSSVRDETAAQNPLQAVNWLLSWFTARPSPIYHTYRDFFLNSGLIISSRHIDRRTCYELSSRRSEQSMINWAVVCQLSW